MLTSVPVSTLTSTAVATASSVSVAPAGAAIDPVMAVVSGGTATTGTSTLTDGPPVMTVTGSDVSHSVSPSTIAANRAYECLESMSESSYGTAKAAGSDATPSIRCSPRIAPASGVAVWSTSVTTATAVGERAIGSAEVIVPVTAVTAATAWLATPSDPSTRSATIATAPSFRVINSVSVHQAAKAGRRSAACRGGPRRGRCSAIERQWEYAEPSR